MKVYITKYALTEGIFVVEGAPTESTSDRMFAVTPDYTRTFSNVYYHVEGRDWHRTWESACARAEKMVVDKLKSIDKQRKRLAELKFTKPEGGP